MPTEHEHIMADWAATVESDGVETTIDGETVEVFSPPTSMSASEFERSISVVKQLFHLSGALPLKVPEQIVEIGGERWIVAEHVDYGISARLTVVRHIG